MKTSEESSRTRTKKFKDTKILWKRSKENSLNKETNFMTLSSKTSITVISTRGQTMSSEEQTSILRKRVRISFNAARL